eukprot:Nitzschia sp. Nitz4//scaffold42_size132992//94838//96019//NITZ4_003412-RA/size132992-processed-gene-0.43-mRNA-1//-1//CDS//3329551757//9371//frame0
MMLNQDPLKSIFWLWLFKSFRPCFAGRWSDGDGFSSYTSRYSFFARTPGNLSFRWKSTHGPFERRRWINRILAPDTFFGLPIPASYSLQREQAVLLPPGLSQALKRHHSIPGAPSDDDENLPETKKANVPTGKDHAIRLTRPLIPLDAWDAMTGFEFEEEDVVHALSQSGLELCSHGANPYVEWKPHRETERILLEQDATEALNEGRVLVHVGRAKQAGFGSHLPLIKSQSILPISSKGMADLLMDSSRVKLYNKMSMGRRDVRVLNDRTKIVSNVIQPPIGKSKFVSVTMMHTRSLNENDRNRLGIPDDVEGCLVVSRAVPSKVDKDMADLPRSDILLGVNLLQDIGPNQCKMTAVTHVYSPAVPTLLASNIGVKSAQNFVRDIRAACGGKK